MIHRAQTSFEQGKRRRGCSRCDELADKSEEAACERSQQVKTLRFNALTSKHCSAISIGQHEALNQRSLLRKERCCGVPRAAFVATRTLFKAQRCPPTLSKALVNFYKMRASSAGNALTSYEHSSAHFSTVVATSSFSILFDLSCDADVPEAEQDCDLEVSLTTDAAIAGSGGGFYFEFSEPSGSAKEDTAGAVTNEKSCTEYQTLRDSVSPTIAANVRGFWEQCA
eukprot:18170-Heterococcus_DN1.PRE.1